MAKSAGNAVSKGIVWVILLLLIVGLAGFGATSFGGSMSSIGSVGDTEIGMERYGRAVQQEIRTFEAQTGQRMTFQQAQSMGLDRIVLQRLVALAALEDEAADLGISVGDEEIRREIVETEAFQGIDGNFDREAYTFALNNAGVTVAEYEDSLRDDIARSVLQGAIVAGIQPPQAFVDTLYAYAREARDLTLVRFGEGDLDAPLGDPSDEDLQAYYDANPEAFTLPQRKRITYAWLSPQMMGDTIEIDEDQIRTLYEERADEYDQPERRLVERLVFPDAEAAEAASQAIASGDTDFDTLVEDRGLSLTDIDLGEVARADLPEAVGEAVFGVEGGGTTPPVQTDLGPALFRVNAVLGAQVTPFEDVRDALRDEIAMDAARRAIEDRIEPVEDLLASGLTLEEIADETVFESGEILYSPEIASVAGADIDAYDEFRAVADRTETGDFPELTELSDGGLFALRVNEVIEPTLQPLDEVRDAATEAWRADALAQRLTARAEAAMAAVRDGEELSAQGGRESRETGVLRDAFLDDAPEDLVTQAFALPRGGLAVLTGPASAILLRVDEIIAPDPATDEATEIKRNVTQATGQGIAQDLTEAFTGAIQSQKGINLNQQAVSAVNAQFN